MKVYLDLSRTLKTEVWIVTLVLMSILLEVSSLSGPHVCMVQQKYNITKRVKYRAPMSVRTYEWCFSMPPRCSKWNTEMRDLTRLESEERTAEMAVCCPGYKMKDVSCVPICPNGRTGYGCSKECPPNKWGPNCVHNCKPCEHGSCSAVTGECACQEGWQGESCGTSMPTTASAAMMELLTTTQSTVTKISTLPPADVTPKRSVKVETIPTTTPITSTVSTTKTPTTKQTTMLSTTNKVIITSMTTQKPTTVYNNVTQVTLPTLQTYTTLTEEISRRYFVTNSNYKTETSEKTSKVAYPSVTPAFMEPTTKPIVATSPPTTVKLKPRTEIMVVTTDAPLTSARTTLKETTTKKMEIPRKPETTIRPQTTIKFKPKEIWIRPAQKGESALVESKLMPHQEMPKNKGNSKNEISEPTTTPKTIVVSIIPTSVSYASFKKIALTTASYVSQKNNLTIQFTNRTATRGFTKPMAAHTTVAPFTVKIINVPPKKFTANPPFLENVTKSPQTSITTKAESFEPTHSFVNQTNSMSSTLNAVVKRLNSSNILTTVSVPSTNVTKPTRRPNTFGMTTRPHNATTSRKTTQATRKETTVHPSLDKIFVTIKQRNVTLKTMTNVAEVTKTPDGKQTETSSKRNLTNFNTNAVTDDPTKDEETIHVLTEPEHITAVMGDKGRERSSVDLISVISIAGGVMMAIITVAVVIVMLERCKRPRYDDVRKYNNIRMQVMIDNNDVPPPYVRSIFHTPLPDPPTSEKCHYQPISTLDRNLKQFMRPVVVQTISPLMLENFRGILECHYDHLPRRSHDMSTMDTRCSVAPSIEECEELLHERAHSVTDSDIEAMKCEAKFDVIDNTTAEPLYAEIPCWRPPSEHAVEVVNLNGEAVTEL